MVGRSRSSGRRNVEGGDGDSGDDRVMPVTQSDLCDVFHELYPDCDGQLFRNELTEKDSIDMAMFGMGGGIREIDSDILTIYHDDIERRLKDCGYSGKVPSKETKDDVLEYQLFKHLRNPFRDWVQSHEWDGTPRLRTWFRDTFGATAPPLSKEDEEAYLGDVAEAWFLGAIGRMYGPFKHEVVPVFIGLQGVGKGQALRYTAGLDDFFISSLEDITARDGKARFLDSVRGAVIVEMGEAVQFRGDVSVMKGFISQEVDRFRKPYKPVEGSYPRRFILASSSNLDNLFSDETGNRRYYPMYCDASKATRLFSVSDRSVGQYDVEQLWAEALYLFNNGGKAYVQAGPSMDRAVTMQEYCTAENSEADVINRWLDNPASGHTEVGARVNKQMIFEGVFGYNIATQLLNKDANRAYQKWCDSQINGVWVKLDNVSIDGGEPGRAYERRIAARDAGQIKDKFLMVSTSNDDVASAKLESLIRRLARDFSLADGGIITEEMLDDLSRNDLKILIDNGCLEQVGEETVFRRPSQ